MKNVNEAKAALTDKPLFATSAERFLILNEIKSQYKELTQPLRFSKYLNILLSRVSTPIEPFDLIAGRLVDRLLTDAEEREFQKFITHKDNPKNFAILNSGHTTYSWEMLVNEGLSGLIGIVKTQLKTEINEDKRVFLTAMLEVYTAITDYILRYSATARSMGMTSLADNLEKCALTRPDSFYSALQLLWIITFINCAYISSNPTLTVGRLDKILYPLYRADIEKGVLTKDLAKEYITDYYCKHNLIMGRGEHQVGDENNSTTFDRILCFDAPQYLILAGTDEDGNRVVNDLTMLFSECIVPEFKNPVVVVRYFKNLDKDYPKLWTTLCEKALASSSLMFYNDGNVISTYKRIGLPFADASKFEHFGCNWPSAGDNCAWMNIGPRSAKFDAYKNAEERAFVDVPFMRMNSDGGWPEDLLSVLRELSYKENVTVDDIYDGFFARMQDFIDLKLKRASLELEVRRRRPSAVLTFGDCFRREPVWKAECFSSCAKYHFELQPFQMFGTVADCIITVDKLVFIDKRLTLKQLLDAADADFEGYPEILALCLGVDKYGSDTPHSNAHVNRLARTASDLVINMSKPYFEKYRLFLAPCIQSDTWHLKKGITFGATVDGRRAGKPFSQNIRPSNGACVNGVTAMLNSILSLPSDGYLSGALNLDVEPNQFKGTAMFAAVLGTYFNRGGLHAQVSCADSEKLRSAQKDPDSYRDIRVRVTGYSGVFVDICKTLQDDIIERFE